jgi:type I restriction enzyme S subunit
MSDWRQVALGEICSIEIGGTPSRSEPRYWWKSDEDGIRLPWVSISDMKGKVITDTKESITENGALQSNCKHVPKGTLLMSFKLTIGRLAFAGRDLYTNEAISAIKPLKDACPEFLYYGLQYWNLTGDSDQAVKGVTLNKQKLQEIPCLLPPLPEQKKIAEILSGIDKVIDNLKSCLGKQVILKNSLLSELIFYSDANPGLSSKTNPCCLGDISTRITDGTHQAVKTSKDGIIPFLYVSCVKDGIIDWSKSALISEEQYAIATQGRQPSRGDILYTAVGSYGNAAMVTTNHRFCFQRHIALIQLDKEKAVPKFIELALSSDQTKKSVDQVVAGNAQPTLTLGELRKLQIPLPPPETQRKICEVIYPVEQKCSALENKINAMHSLKQAVASDLLSGRKRVTV